MPFYDYKCSKCNHTFTEFKKIDNRLVPCDAPCPHCKEEKCVDFSIGAPAFNYTTVKMPTNTKLKEKLTQIHENTHGSVLDKTSTITKI